MTNLLIVESKNDKAFLQAFIKQLNYEIEISSPIKIDDYEELSGLSPSSLVKSLKSVANSLLKREIQKIGILLDLDVETRESRIHLVNESLKSAFQLESELSDVGQLIEIQTFDGGISLQAACYFMNVNGQGELETLLRKIKSQPSPHADCLEKWRECLTDAQVEISQKEFDKFWVSNYLRYDTCSPQERKQAGRKCSFSNLDYIMENKIEIWNLGDPVLDDLKQFLKLFSD